MSAQPDVWIVRHGETEWSKSGRHTGRTDIELTPDGEKAAIAMASRLQSEGFDRVLSSPLQRARRSAELAGFADIEVDPDLAEWDYGVYEGRLTADIRGTTTPDWSIWTHYEGAGETLAEVAARADAVIEKICAHDGKVIIFSHSHYLRVFTARWMTVAPETGQHLLLETSAVGVLGWYRETPVIRRWNV